MTQKSVRNRRQDTIYNTILNKIQYCEWLPGMPISEMSLSETFQISRTPIREALSLLSRRGFVDIYPQAGSFISKIDIKRIREIQYLRYHVELPILLELAKSHKPVPERIEQLLLLEEFAAKKENWVECVQLDYSIHEELITWGNHKEIWDLIAPELPHCTRLRFFKSNYSEFKGEVPTTLKEHQQLVKNIADGDVDAIRHTMDVHYNHVIAISDDFRSNSNHHYLLEQIKQYPDYFVNLGVL